jgi:hypothetical protein
MRSWWPIPASRLDNKRLLGEHNELLIMARAIAGLNKGYKNHPETRRWTGHSKAMKRRHDEIAVEMQLRGFNHKSPWPDNVVNLSDTDAWPLTFWEPLEVMETKLAAKIAGMKG